jgi:hypothetical protein
MDALGISHAVLLAGLLVTTVSAEGRRAVESGFKAGIGGGIILTVAVVEAVFALVWAIQSRSWTRRLHSLYDYSEDLFENRGGDAHAAMPAHRNTANLSLVGR